MGFGSRKVFCLGVVAVLVSVYVPGEGSPLNQQGRKDEETGLLYDDAENAEKTDPKEVSTALCGYSVKNLSFHCGANFTTKVFGRKLKLEPEVNVKFVPEDLEIQMSVTNRGKTVFTHEITSEDLDIPMCVRTPLIPFIGICLEIEDQIISVEDKSVSFCARLGLDIETFIPDVLNPLSDVDGPSISLGCFSASKHDGVKYKRPKIKVPGKKKMKKFFGKIAKKYRELKDDVKAALGYKDSVKYQQLIEEYMRS